MITSTIDLVIIGAVRGWIAMGVAVVATVSLLALVGARKVAYECNAS